MRRIALAGFIVCLLAVALLGVIKGGIFEGLAYAAGAVLGSGNGDIAADGVSSVDLTVELLIGFDLLLLIAAVRTVRRGKKTAEARSGATGTPEEAAGDAFGMRNEVIFGATPTPELVTTLTAEPERANMPMPEAIYTAAPRAATPSASQEWAQEAAANGGAFGTRSGVVTATATPTPEPIRTATPTSEPTGASMNAAQVWAQAWDQAWTQAWAQTQNAGAGIRINPYDTAPRDDLNAPKIGTQSAAHGAAQCAE